MFPNDDDLDGYTPADETPQHPEEDDSSPQERSSYKVPVREGDNLMHLSGMFQDWFLDYASYVIL